MLRKSFKVRICKTLPKKACLEYHIGNCDAPCEFESAGKKYAGHMAELQNVLSDGKGMVRYERTLEKMMREASNDSRFEEAIEIRETLRRLQSLKGRQNMERSSSVRDEDYVGILTVGDDAHVMSMRQSNGIIRDRERFSSLQLQALLLQRRQCGYFSSQDPLSVLPSPTWSFNEYCMP